MPSFQVASLIRDRQLIEVASAKRLPFWPGQTKKSLEKKSTARYAKCGQNGTKPMAWSKSANPK